MAKKRKPPRLATPPAPPPPPVPPPRDTVTEDTPLTDDERRFVEEWEVDRVAAAAYRRAFPGCTHRQAWWNGWRMRRQPNVAAEIRYLVRAQRIRDFVSADKVIEELARIGSSDILEMYDPATNQLRHPRHIPYNLRKCISEVKVQRQRSTRRGRATVTDQIVSYRLYNKLDALGKLMKHLGLETEITPLEVLLAALPRALAEQVRQELAAERTLPSTNGRH